MWRVKRPANEICMTGCFLKHWPVPSSVFTLRVTLMKLLLSHCCCLLQSCTLLQPFSPPQHLRLGAMMQCSAELHLQGSCSLQPPTKAKVHRHLIGTRGKGRGDSQVLPPFPRTAGQQKQHLLCVERMRMTSAAWKAVSYTRRWVQAKWLWGCSEIRLSNATKSKGLHSQGRHCSVSHSIQNHILLGCGSSSCCWASCFV